MTLPLKHLIAMMLILLVPLHAMAENDYRQQVQELILADQAPEGVVFEIVSGKQRYLDWALQEAESLSRQLHDKFPELEIAIVSHGAEQFALTSKRLADNAPLNSVLKTLVDSDVKVHVCGTYAERKGVDAGEFSELVDVAAEGPAQINDYIKLGYRRIRIVKN